MFYLNTRADAVQVGFFNRTGLRWHGSKDIWVLNEIAHLTDVLNSKGRFTGSQPARVPWVNGNAYVRSGETFGILPLSDESRSAMGMKAFSGSLAKEQKLRHTYLAQRQNVLYAVLPMHSSEEYSLFRLLVNSPDGLFSGTHEPNWLAVTVVWSKHADGQKIFNKVDFLILLVLKITNP